MNYETEKQELFNKRTELVLSKREHEMKLLVAKNVIRSGSRLSSDKYKQCCESQNTHARALLHIEKQLAPIKTRLREIADIEFKSRTEARNGPGRADAPKAGITLTKSILTELVSLRQEYQNFAADGTRVSSMRQMAAEFVLKLNPIIKREISAD